MGCEMKTKVYVQGGKVINVGPWDEQRRIETWVLLNGEVIHVGAWDFGERTELRMMKDGECVGILLDGLDVTPDDVSIKAVVTIDNPLPDGAVVEEFEVILNPIPPGAVEEEIEIMTTAKGRIVAQDDYRSLRADEYPSLGDQLDALWKGGDAVASMLAAITAIKAKYPKTVGA